MYAPSELTREMVGKKIAVHGSKRSAIAGAPPAYVGVLRYDSHLVLARLREADRFYFETTLAGDRIDGLGFVDHDCIEIIEKEEVPE